MNIKRVSIVLLLGITILTAGYLFEERSGIAEDKIAEEEKCIFPVRHSEKHFL